MDDAEDVRMEFRQLVGDGRSPVLRAVIDGDHLELLRQRGQCRQRLGDECLEVRFLVVGGEEERQLGDFRGRDRRARSLSVLTCVHGVPFLLMTCETVSPSVRVKSLSSYMTLNTCIPSGPP